MTSVDAALRDATQQLIDSSESAALDARLLLEHVLDVGTAWVVVHGRDALTDTAANRLQALVDRRRVGEPVAYLTGHIGFWSLDLMIDARVLVPRPDTETLVDAALATLPSDRPLKVVDLGTGSGAIALALAHERPAWRMSATDASIDALDCARANAQRLDLAHVDFAHGPWFDALSPGQRFDAILSNPPYIDADDAHLAAAALSCEPQAALVAGDHGLADLRILVSHAPLWLADDGWLLLEHGYDQAQAVARMFIDEGYSEPRHWHDLGGHIRVTGAQWTHPGPIGDS